MNKEDFLKPRINLWRLIRLLLIGIAYLIAFSWGYVKFYGFHEFVPPTESERLKAIGDVANLPARDKVAYSPEFFIPMGKPQPFDWLYQFPEPGQSYDQYMQSGFKHPDKKRNVFYIIPVFLGNPKEIPFLKNIEEYSRLFFGLQTKVLPPKIIHNGVSFRKRDSGNQFDAIQILDQIKRDIPPDGFCLMGVTVEDIFPQDNFNFVFGLASPDDKTGIYSLARLNPVFYKLSQDESLYLVRSLKLISHEAGHIFGLYHCIYFNCLMNGCNNLPESDRSTLHLCPVCLRKLQTSNSFDNLKRYADLELFYYRHGLASDAIWVNRMLLNIAMASHKH